MIKLARLLLRRRRPVRADHRLRTDDDPVRTQSAILDKTHKTPMLLFITLFSRYGYAFHPYRENRVGARSAQVFLDCLHILHP